MLGERCRCLLNLSPDDGGACRKFIYDPLRRTPRTAPKLGKFDPEDFSL